MIGGITKGSCFSGCVEYALALKEKNKEARLLYSEGLLTDTPKDIIDGFECQRHLNSRVQHWCGHISLSYSPKDAERMSDEFMVKLALEYMDKMGIKNTQFIIVRHLDSSTKSLCSAKNVHPHCHIVYNRVDNDGKCVSDSFEYYRNNEITNKIDNFTANPPVQKLEKTIRIAKESWQVYLAMFISVFTFIFFGAATIWQESRIERARISDIKYHYILMHGGVNSEGLDSIQSWFRDPERVKQIEKEVKDYEDRVQETARALDQKHRLEEKINELNSQANPKSNRK